MRTESFTLWPTHGFGGSVIASSRSVSLAVELEIVTSCGGLRQVCDPLRITTSGRVNFPSRLGVNSTRQTSVLRLVVRPLMLWRHSMRRGDGSTRTSKSGVPLISGAFASAAFWTSISMTKGDPTQPSRSCMRNSTVCARAASVVSSRARMARRRIMKV